MVQTVDFPTPPFPEVMSMVSGMTNSSTQNYQPTPAFCGDRSGSGLRKNSGLLDLSFPRILLIFAQFGSADASSYIQFSISSRSCKLLWARFFESFV